jgi:Flp pilus assembly protein TadD
VRRAHGDPDRTLPSEVLRFRWAESLLEQRDPLGALRMLRPLLDEHGADRGVRLLAARAWFASAQLNRALAALEELAAGSPGDPYVQVLLGRTLQRLGRGGEAVPHLRMGAAMTGDAAAPGDTTGRQQNPPGSWTGPADRATLLGRG